MGTSYRLGLGFLLWLDMIGIIIYTMSICLSFFLGQLGYITYMMMMMMIIMMMMMINDLYMINTIV